MAPKHHPTPLSGGDRKALNKEFGKARAMTNILARQVGRDADHGRDHAAAGRQAAVRKLERANVGRRRTHRPVADHRPGRQTRRCRPWVRIPISPCPLRGLDSSFLLKKWKFSRRIKEVDNPPLESGPRRSGWKRPCYPLGRAAGITFHLRCRLNNGRTAGGKRPNAGRQRHAASARLCNPDCGCPTRSPADRCEEGKFTA
jgi:hypothetical protein